MTAARTGRKQPSIRTLWAIAKSPELHLTDCLLYTSVQDFIDYDGPDRTGYAERYALGLGISPQSLYR